LRVGSVKRAKEALKKKKHLGVERWILEGSSACLPSPCITINHPSRQAGRKELHTKPFVVRVSARYHVPVLFVAGEELS
jgi:hypothetical protein